MMFMGHKINLYIGKLKLETDYTVTCNLHFSLCIVSYSLISLLPALYNYYGKLKFFVISICFFLKFSE